MKNGRRASTNCVTPESRRLPYDHSNKLIGACSCSNSADNHGSNYGENKMRAPLPTLALSLIFLSILSPYASGQMGNHCKVTPTRSDALDWPSKHAWNLFMMLNHPSIDEALRRGVPDCTKPIGAPGTTTVWETWRNAESEVFVPSEPPEWNDHTTLPDMKPGQVPNPSPVQVMSITGLDGASFADASFHSIVKRNEVEVMLSPDGVFSGSGGIGETRINKTTYEFIKDQCLYNRQGLMRYANAIIAGKKDKISLPADSIEVKAVWIDFEWPGTAVPPEKWDSYYTAQCEQCQKFDAAGEEVLDENGNPILVDKTLGLAALHVLTKDTPNWFWATFHHNDNPSNIHEMEDTFGRPADLSGTVWENYALGGAQIDFTSPDGKASILSDHFVEFGFQKSSCISCHATATISTDFPQGSGNALSLAQQRSICLLDPSIFQTGFCSRLVGEHFYKLDLDANGKPKLDGEGNLIRKNELIEERGTPVHDWFLKNGEEFYFQTDFLYSIPFRAGRVEEANAAPQRCMW